MLPMPPAPSSTIKYLVVSVVCKIEYGAPTSLLYDSIGAIVSPEVESISRNMFLVVVFPLEPVMPTTLRLDVSRIFAKT